MECIYKDVYFVDYYGPCDGEVDYIDSYYADEDSDWEEINLYACAKHEEIYFANLLKRVNQST